MERVDARWFVTMGEIGNLFGGDTFCFSSGTGGLVGRSRFFVRGIGLFSIGRLV